MARPRMSMLAKFRAGTIKLKGRNVRERLEEAPMRRPQEVPVALAGKYIAWSSDGFVILGAGDTVEEALAGAAGDPRPIIEWIPTAEEARAISLPSAD